MALDKIQAQFGAGFNPFIKPKNDEDSQAKGIEHHQGRHLGRRLALGKQDGAPDKPAYGLSFLKEGALGLEEALHVKNGRAGASLNTIS